MKPVAEMLVMVYNTEKNVREGSWNNYSCVEVTDEAKIKETITEQFNGPLATRNGAVLVKYKDDIWLCERDTVNPKKVYTRHKVTYHPLMGKFSI